MVKAFKGVSAAPAIGGGLMLAAALALAPLASASVITQRDSAYVISFPSGLDSATTSYTVTLTLPTGGSNYSSATVNLKSGNEGMTVGTTGGVTTTIGNQVAGTPSATGDINNDGSGGTFDFNYVTANGPDFTSSWTESTVVGGYNTLSFGGFGNQGFGGCGSNLLDLGGIFTCEVFIYGNWTNGHAPGDGYITNLSAGYSTINDFVYNSTLNWTLVGVSTGNYTGVDPNLGINLVGSAVPEPATWTLLLAGLGLAAVGGGLRGRRTA